MSDDPQPVAVDALGHEERILADYRGLLTKTAQEAQTAFDKTLLTLSGGALGLSFVFTKDVVGPQNIVHHAFLLWAWICWGLSSTAILLSFFTSQQALRRAIQQLDAGALTSCEKMETPGGWFDTITGALNFSGLMLFLCGLGMMITFLGFNVGRRANSQAPQQFAPTSASRPQLISAPTKATHP
jgi:hypothetical protein